MVDAPRLAIVEAEAFGGGQEKHPPAPPPHGRVCAIDMHQDGVDTGPVCVKRFQPLQGGAPVMGAAPAPVLFNREKVGRNPSGSFGTARNSAARASRISLQDEYLVSVPW